MLPIFRLYRFTLSSLQLLKIEDLALIISKTPYRVSFFGGGTDFPEWFSENQGAVLSTTINKYCYISCRELPPFFSHKHRLVYSSVEEADENSDIKHPAIRGIFEWMNIQKGMEIHHDGDLPARSGLGSSSSFTVGLLHALKELLGQKHGKDDLANDAIHVERTVIGETVGLQDQIAAAYGGFNSIEFHKGGGFKVNPISLSDETQRLINSHLMLFFTKQQRISFEIEKRKLAKINQNLDRLMKIYELVQEGESLLQMGSFEPKDFGNLLHQSWLLKRDLSEEVSTEAITQAYDVAISAGAYGGKVLGAGGGGFMMFFAPPEVQAAIIQQLKHFIYVPVSMESVGSSIVLSQPKGL